VSVQSLQVYNLPPQPTPFVGRKPEIEEIVSLLSDENCRLLTLIGPGGMGKTRLAMESVHQLTHTQFQYGVFYIPLAPLTSVENIVTTMIDILGITISTEATSSKQLLKFLSSKNLLLLMDNFEHLLDAVDLVAEILHHAPQVKILTTSREPLNLQQEWLWHVKGMRVPDAQSNDIEPYSALKLFIDRAHRIRRDFDVDTHLDCVIRICQLVGGMPLGIELAAGWLKTLSCKDIIHELERGIDVLSTRARDIPERHRSIRAVFDYSWMLLSADEQAVFCRLSVFRGGFTLMAAQAIADADLITLSSLVEKSMVQLGTNGRYDMHELVRQYAESRLMQADEHEAIDVPHMNYFAQFTAELTEDLKGERQIEAHFELMSDYPNVIKAWTYAVMRSEYDVIGAMLEALNANNFLNNNRNPHLLLLDSAHVQIQNPTTREHQITANQLIAWKIYWLASATYQRFVHGSVETALNLSKPVWVDECLLEARDNNDLIAQILCHIARALLMPTVTGLADDYILGLKLSRQSGDPWYECRCLNLIVDYFHYTKRIKDSKGDEYLEQYQEIADANGIPYDLYCVHNNRAIASFDHGDVQTAIQSNKILLKLYSQLFDYGRGFTHLKLGVCYLSLGDFSQARDYIEAGLQLVEEFHQNPYWGYMLLAKLDVVEGNLQGASQQLQKLNYETLGGVFQYECLSLYQLEIGDLAGAREAMLLVLSEGLVYVGSRPMIDLIPHVAFVMVHDAYYEGAVELLGLADNYPSGATDWMGKWDKLTQLRTQLKDRLGEQAYQNAWERGAHLDLDVTVTQLRDYLSGSQAPPKTKPISQPLIDPLTERELEILFLIATGETNRDIASKLYVGLSTVKKHINHIYSKLGVKSRTQAIARARDIGLI